VIPADEAATALFAAAIGAATAHLLVRFRLVSPPRSLVRTNVNGREVPAILGGPLVMSSLLSLLCVALLAALGWQAAGDARLSIATVVVIAGLGTAGAWDDRKGDERARGFSGHLSAVRSRRLTGGLVKAVAGVGSGLLAALALQADLLAGLEIALLVALTANLLNLFDRAPGRAGKVGLALFVPLVFLGDPSWAVMAGGTVGALAALLGFDLSERAMLGDAGANPVGAVLGLGLGVSLGPVGRAVAVGALLILNLASEKWSFSRVIESVAWLRRLDRAGRRTPPENGPAGSSE
jgi:UDP-N-acetylmuramyl pentapeptide phosphotransferase/UDP-N-acetylglucosamine-1-phosphate transferase